MLLVRSKALGHAERSYSALVEMEAHARRRLREARFHAFNLRRLRLGVPKIYSVMAGTSLTEEVLSIAKREKVETAGVAAIGGVNRLRIGYFNSGLKKYEEHDYEGFFEVTSLVGNITLKDGEPFLHVHGTFAKRDMSVIGGHVVSATVFPLLEVVITPTENRAFRKFDEGLGLNTIQKIEPA